MGSPPSMRSADPAPARRLRCALRRGLPALMALLALSCGDSRYLETGDLPEIRSHGRLRILMPPLDPAGLPRRGYAINHERAMARELARRLELDPVLVTVQARDALVDALLEGRGDLVVARLTETDERRTRLSFSEPLGFAREVLAVRAGDESIRAEADLDGRRVGVRPSSSFHATLRALKAGAAPGLEIVSMDEHMDLEAILSEVTAGRLDATVADDDLLEQVLGWRSDIQRGLHLTGPRPVGWVMRPGSPHLKEAVDQFLEEQALVNEPEPVALGDLEAIRKRRVLRVLTRNNAATTFLHRGKQVGFEFELVREFARSIGCRVQLVIPPGYEDLVPWLNKGRGDLIAASMVVTARRSRRVSFTEPYMEANQMVVMRPEDAGEIRGLPDLSGRTVHVRRSSVYRQTLEFLRHARGLPLDVREVPESVETEDLIDGVADGTYEATVALEHILAIARSWRDDIAGALPIGESKQIAWAVRPEDDQLHAAAQAFLEGHGRGSLFLNVLRAKYFGDSARISRRLRNRPEASGRISPWDDVFRKYAEVTGFDWRLLAAQAYQESQFVPTAQSWAGALGLMQLLPRTAREMGADEDLLDPETSIRAGALYLRKLADSYFDDLPEDEQLLFSLGAYNAGPGHIRDGQRLAEEMGLDPDRWFDSVERVLPLLGRASYASKAAYGYCRCGETVAYVSGISELHRRYSAVVN